MKILKFVIILLFPALLITGLIYLLSKAEIKEISCKSQYGECSPLITEKLSKVPPCNYIDCKKKVGVVLSDAWIIDKYSSQLRLPLKIEISVVERKPKYSIKCINSNFFAQIDQDGLVINIKESGSLPGILIDGNLPSLGEKVADNMLFALQLVYGVSKIQSVKTAKLEDSHLSVEIIGDRQVLFPLEKDRDFLLGALTLILNELKKDELNSKIVEGRNIKTIDLRYENPVIR